MKYYVELLIDVMIILYYFKIWYNLLEIMHSFPNSVWNLEQATKYTWKHSSSVFNDFKLDDKHVNAQIYLVLIFIQCIYLEYSFK